MTPARFRLLSGITAVSVVLAGIALATRPPVITAVGDQGEVFPQLKSETDAVAEIRIVSGASKVTLKRQDKRWVYVEHNHYPADPAKVGGFVGALAGLRYVEKKTAQKDSLSRLQLEDPGPDAKSKAVTLLDKDGKPLAALIAGKLSWSLGTRGQAATYVRLPDSTQSWLAMGKVEVPDPALDWMKRSLIDITDRWIQSIEFRQGDALMFTIQRKSEGPFGFTVSPTPGGPVDENKVNQKGAIFAGLQFEEAVSIKGITLPKDLLTATAKSDPGIGATATLFRYEGKDWVKLSFTLDETALKAWAKAYKPDPMRKMPEIDKDPEGALRKAYQDAVAATEGWIFRLPDYKLDQLRAKGVDDFLKGS